MTGQKRLARSCPAIGIGDQRIRAAVARVAHLTPYRINEPQTLCDLRSFGDLVARVEVHLNPSDRGRSHDIAFERGIDEYGPCHLHARVHQIVGNSAAVGVADQHVGRLNVRPHHPDDDRVQPLRLKLFDPSVIWVRYGKRREQRDEALKP